MTHQGRVFVAVLFVGVILASGGVMQTAAVAQTQSNEEEVLDQATIKRAIQAREEAIAEREKIRARNAATDRQYEADLEVFRKADAEFQAALGAYKEAKKHYESLRALDSARLFKSEPGRVKWYQDIIKDHPGTVGAKEAERRLAGEAPRTLAVPSKPDEPKPAIIAPRRPNHELEPSIPNVPTVAELRERRAAAATKAERERKAKEEATAARKAEEEYDVNGLVLLRKTIKGGYTKFHYEVTGIVVNRRSSKLRYAEITFNIYDASGARIGTAIDNIVGLEPGESWKFRAVAIVGGGRSSRLAELSGR